MSMKFQFKSFIYGIELLLISIEDYGEKKNER